MSGPLVTIGIPTRNRVSLLERAVGSALAQQHVELEVVVSDNASTDATAALCERLAASDDRVRVIRHESDIGPERNFRAVLAAARGSYFMWLADDDWLDPGYAAACVSALELAPDHALACGRGRYYRDGAFAFVERRVDIQASSARVRLVGFYRTVGLNGPYYGVMRRQQLQRLPLVTGLASDWLLVAAVAWSGKVRTLDGVAIHRRLEGASEGHASLAGAYGLSRRHAWHVHLLIAAHVFRDVEASPVYGAVGRPERLLLGSVCAALVVVRFWPRAMAARLLSRLGTLDASRRRLERRRGEDARPPGGGNRPDST